MLSDNVYGVIEGRQDSYRIRALSLIPYFGAGESFLWGKIAVARANWLLVRWCPHEVNFK